MRTAVQKFGINTLGRDFVVGDIHGAFDLVIEGMRAVNFNKQHDRLFSVGDLVDRGPGSHRALNFLLQSYVFAAAGNHDDDFSSLSLEEIRFLAGINWNGMGWAKDIDDVALIAIQKKLSELPIAIEIETPRGTVGLLHGDVPKGMTWQDFKTNLERGCVTTTNSALGLVDESRHRVQSRDQTGVAGIDRVFVGHTVQWSGAQRLGNVYAIDTGAVFRDIGKEKGALTMANIACHSQVLAPENNKLDPANRLAIHADAADTPFTSYVSRPAG